MTIINSQSPSLEEAWLMSCSNVLVVFVVFAEEKHKWAGLGGVVVDRIPVIVCKIWVRVSAPEGNKETKLEVQQTVKLVLVLCSSQRPSSECPETLKLPQAT